MIEKLGDRKIRIIKAIIGRENVSVASIQRETGIPRSSLNHHLSILHREGLIIQERRGREILNRVNPRHSQELRAKLKINAPKILISGYTYNPEKPEIKTLEILQRAIEFLEREGIKIEKTIAFTTPLAKKKIRETEYRRGDTEIVIEYDDYSNAPEKIERAMREVIDENIAVSEPIIDLTPLTKLFSIVALSLAKEYGLRAFYHAGNRVVWLS